MITNLFGSAKIYTFPPRGRFAESAPRGDSKGAQLPAGAKLAVGGAWYHDEAIREDEKTERH
jgi:hypothetical protein